jgi:hypothetical protein
MKKVNFESFTGVGLLSNFNSNLFNWICRTNVLFFFVLLSVCASAYTRVSFAYIAITFMVFFASIEYFRARKGAIFATFVFITFIVIKWLVQRSDPYFLVWSGGYFFGYVLFLALGSYLKSRFDQKLLLCAIVFSGLTILDASLVNTLGVQSWMTNYPNLDVVTGHRTFYFGWFQRAYSFGTNSSITSTCLVSIFFAVIENVKNERFKYLILAFILMAIAASFSATGIATLAFGLFYVVNLWKKAIVFLLTLTVMFICDGMWNTNIDLSYRLSTSYFKFLLGLKMTQFSENFYQTASGPIELLFGRSYSSVLDLPFGGDFGWMSLLQTYGIIGMILTIGTIGILIYNSSKENRLPAIILCVGTFHYGVLFSVAGQLLFSLYTIKGRSIAFKHVLSRMS